MSMTGGVAGELLVGVTADVTKAQKQIETGLEQTGSSAGAKTGSSIGKKLAVGLTAAFAAAGVAKFIGDSITAASDLGETANKVSAVFGPAAKDVQAFAKNAATALGQSEQAALDAASTFGVFGKMAGLTGKDLGGFSTELTTLSSDLASFYNADPSEVVTALGAALRGEMEPMRRFGVVLDADTIAAKGMEMGLTKMVDKNGKMVEVFDKSRQALAVQALVMEQTSIAQGDFAKTSDGLANQQRILAAEVENQKAALGQALLPAMLAVISAIRPMVATLLPAFGKAFEVIGPILVTLVGGLVAVGAAVGAFAGWVRDNVVVAALLGAALLAVTAAVTGFSLSATIASGVIAVVRAGYAAWTAVQWALNAAMAANPIGLVIAAILVLVAAVVYAWQNSETFRDIVIGVWEKVQAVVGKVGDWFTGTLWPALQRVWDGIQSGVEALVGFVTGAWNGIKDAIETVAKAIRTVVEFYVKAWIAVFDFLKDIVTKVVGAFTAARDKVSEWMTTIRTLVGQKVDAVVSWFAERLDLIVGKVTGAFTAAKSKAGDLLDGIRDWIGGRVDLIVGAFGTALNFVAKVDAAIDKMRAAILSGIGDMLGKVGSKAGEIVDAVGTAIGKMAGVGRDMVEGLWRGISGGWSWLTGKVRDLAGSLVSAVKSKLGIGSPSKVFASIGSNIVEGVQVGIAAQAGDLANDLRNLVPVTGYDQTRLLDRVAVGATATVSRSPAVGVDGTMVAPTVQVFIGNSELDAYLVRVQEHRMSAAAARLVAGGV